MKQTTQRALWRAGWFLWALALPAGAAAAGEARRSDALREGRKPARFAIVFSFAYQEDDL